MCCNGFALSLALFVNLSIVTVIVKIITFPAFHLQFFDLFAFKTFMYNFLLNVEVSGKVLRRAALKQISVVNIYTRCFNSFIEYQRTFGVVAGHCRFLLS